MTEDTELELLITVVVGAAEDRAARRACRELVHGIGGEIVASGDCSDEEPGCWSITIRRTATEPAATAGSAVLSRTVRSFLRKLGPDYARHRVSCEPPTAWAVVDDPELVGHLVPGGERLLIEAWVGDSVLAEPLAISGELEHEVAEELNFAGSAPESPSPSGLRLGLLVDVVTECKAGAQWPARALASRLSETITITSCTEQPPMVRVGMDLGPTSGEPSDVVHHAVATLGGTGWSRPRARDRTAVARWVTASTPRSGIAAIELSVTEPSDLDG